MHFLLKIIHERNENILLAQFYIKIADAFKIETTYISRETYDVLNTHTDNTLWKTSATFTITYSHVKTINLGYLAHHSNSYNISNGCFC